MKRQATRIVITLLALTLFPLGCNKDKDTEKKITRKASTPPTADKKPAKQLQVQASPVDRKPAVKIVVPAKIDVAGLVKLAQTHKKALEGHKVKLDGIFHGYTVMMGKKKVYRTNVLQKKNQLDPAIVCELGNEIKGAFAGDPVSVSGVIRITRWSNNKGEHTYGVSLENCKAAKK